MEIWGVAISKGHTGKRLLSKMVKENEELAKAKGFAFAFCYCSNVKTAVGVSKLDFEKVRECDSLSFEFNGAQPFSEIEEEHRYSSIWLKKI
jgi:hypothetical protein